MHEGAWHCSHQDHSECMPIRVMLKALPFARRPAALLAQGGNSVVYAPHHACLGMQCMTALHCARRHWAPLTQRAIVPSMHHAVHASESDAETCLTKPQCREFIPRMQNLAMQMHTAPAGTQHGSREPQSCACTPGMQYLAMQMHCTVPPGTQHGSREP